MARRYYPGAPGTTLANRLIYSRVSNPDQRATFVCYAGLLRGSLAEKLGLQPSHRQARDYTSRGVLSELATTRPESGTNGFVGVPSILKLCVMMSPTQILDRMERDGLFAFHGMLFARVWPRTCHLLSAPRHT